MKINFSTVLNGLETIAKALDVISRAGQELLALIED